MFGKYVDFSSAWTWPHPLLTRSMGDDFPPLKVAEKDARDLGKIMHHWNTEHPKQKIWRLPQPSETYRMKLRPREPRKKPYWECHPADFTYEKARKRFKNDKLKTSRSQESSRAFVKPKDEEEAPLPVDTIRSTK